MPRLKRKTTAEQAAAMVIEQCIEGIGAGRRVTVESDDPEGPHQLRIGLRRLRVALSFFRPAIDSHAARRLAQEAKWLGREVGKVRDLEVARDLVASALAAHEDVDGDVVSGALSAVAAAERDALRALLSSDRIEGFMRSLEAFVTHRGWLVRPDFAQTERLARRLDALSGESLARRWRKASAAAAGMPDHSVDQRHEFRKELKKLRYSVEFVLPLLPKDDATRFLKRLKKLQAEFGHANDLAVVRRVLDCLGRSDIVTGGELDRIGSALDDLETQAEHDLALVQRHWRKLEAVTKPWA